MPIASVKIIIANSGVKTMRDARNFVKRLRLKSLAVKSCLRERMGRIEITLILPYSQVDLQRNIIPYYDKYYHYVEYFLSI